MFVASEILLRIDGNVGSAPSYSLYGATA